MHKILLVEDSEECQLLVKKTLNSTTTNVTVASTGSEAMEIIDNLSNAEFDLVLLDMSLPDSDGIQILDHIQNSQMKKTPVFFLTSNSELTSKVTAFSLGADDYMIKPFSPLELRARIESKLRKMNDSSSSSEALKLGNLSLNIALLQATLTENQITTPLDLTAKEFKILCFLSQNEGKVYSRADIMKKVWGESVHVMDRTVDSHICTLRKKCVLPKTTSNVFRTLVTDFFHLRTETNRTSKSQCKRHLHPNRRVQSPPVPWKDSARSGLCPSQLRVVPF